MDRTLDVPEQQVLVDFFDDDNGFIWHHRLLLLPTASPGVWVASSPDWEIERLDLNQHRVLALGRAANFPRAQQGQIYHFAVPVDEEALRRVRGDARHLQSVLGAPAGGDRPADVGVWRVSDPSSLSFGEELPVDIMRDPQQFVAPPQAGTEEYPIALAKVDGGWVAVQCVPDERLAAWKRDLVSAHGRDDRVLGDKRDGDSKRRFMAFREAIVLSHAPKLPELSLTGPRVSLEFLRALENAGMEWMSHHLDFVHKSGVSSRSAVVRAHRRVTEALQLMMQEDQLNLGALASAEALVRFLAQIEAAVARNPRVPDFADLDSLTGSTVTEAGALVLPEFHKHVAQLQRDEAFTMKQRRQWYEEQQALARRYGSEVDGADGKGRGRRGKGSKGSGRGDGAAGGSGGAAAP